MKNDEKGGFSKAVAIGVLWSNYVELHRAVG